MVSFMMWVGCNSSGKREACRHISHTFRASSHASHRSCLRIHPSLPKAQETGTKASSAKCAQKASNCSFNWDPFFLFPLPLHVHRSNVLSQLPPPLRKCPFAPSLSYDPSRPFYPAHYCSPLLQSWKKSSASGSLPVFSYI